LRRWMRSSLIHGTALLNYEQTPGDPWWNTASMGWRVYAL
jgi:hypothetical protein